ncbi:MAG TPA: hypothetical protein VK489_11270 [Ferruginibacter sp.]|nr:hypothetical protein [Ferruginibacter sp.]
MRKYLLFFLIPFLLPASICAQARVNKDEIRVFVDCNTWCDMDYVKTEINYVDFMPDRFTANVYVLITSQPTGSGGIEVKLFFSGRENFKGMEDTLKLYRTSVETDAEYREKMVRYLKTGLTRFIAQTSLAEKIIISVPVLKDETSVNSLANKKDKWNFWVFNISASASVRSDDLSRYKQLSGRISANRTTDRSKVGLNVNINRSASTFTEANGDKTRISNNSSSFDATMVGSLNSHWSVGGFGNILRSEFSNYDIQVMLHPAIEYSFFPYKEAVKKSITLFYRIGPSYNEYFDTSIYILPEHWLFQHSLSLNVGFIQKWGNMSMNASWDNFLNSFESDSLKVKGRNVNTFSVGGNLDIRIAKGLSFYISCYTNFTKGVYPNISGNGVTLTDLLTGSRQYATQRYTSLYFSVNYRFGSIYNNVVNPRFNGSSF